MENVRVYKNIIARYRKYMKTRLATFRVTELLLSIMTLALVAFQYFEVVLNSLWNLVSILYLCGMMFTINAQYQDTCKAKRWATASRVFATIIYLATAALLVLIILDSFMVISINNL